jgi:hypothetical protein
LDCIRDRFNDKLAKLFQDALAEVTQVQDGSPEVNERRESFPIELADHLLWLTASIYTGEGGLGSEAIYELAKSFEELSSESEEVEAEESEPRLVSEHDVN